MRRVILLATLTLILATASALAAGIDGRFGITGKAGALVPLKDDFVSIASGTEAGFAAGGGLSYGFGGNFSAELDVTHVPEFDVKISGSKAYEASLTDLALGIQYRFVPDNRLVPFVGVGIDFIKGGLKSVSGAEYDLDWTTGGHVNAGFDYFVTRGIAITTEVRGVYAAKGDVTGGTAAKYDPTSFIGTLGVRLFLPEHPFP